MNLFCDRRSNDAGFTLIEMLIVIVVLGILAGIVTILVGSTRGDAIASACKTNFKSIELSAEGVYSKTASYPLTANVNDLLSTNNKGGVLKEMPTSTDYSLVYTSSAGTDFTITVKDKNGVTKGTTTAACDAL